MNEASAFNPYPTAAYHATGCTSCGPASASIGIHVVSGNNLAVRNVTVLGFGTCYQSGLGPDGKGASQLVVEHLTGDCAIALDLKTPDFPVLRDCTNGQLLAAHLLNSMLYR